MRINSLVDGQDGVRNCPNAICFGIFLGYKWVHWPRCSMRSAIDRKSLSFRRNLILWKSAWTNGSIWLISDDPLLRPTQASEMPPEIQRNFKTECDWAEDMLFLPSTLSVNRSKNVPGLHLRSFSRAWSLPINPAMRPSSHSLLRCTRVSCIAS